MMFLTATLYTTGSKLYPWLVSQSNQLIVAPHRYSTCVSFIGYLFGLYKVATNMPGIQCASQHLLAKSAVVQHFEQNRNGYQGDHSLFKKTINTNIFILVSACYNKGNLLAPLARNTNPSSVLWLHLEISAVLLLLSDMKPVLITLTPWTDGKLITIVKKTKQICTKQALKWSYSAFILGLRCCFMYWRLNRDYFETSYKHKNATLSTFHLINLKYLIHPETFSCSCNSKG